MRKPITVAVLVAAASLVSAGVAFADEDTTQACRDEGLITILGCADDTVDVDNLINDVLNDVDLDLDLLGGLLGGDDGEGE